VAFAGTARSDAPFLVEFIAKDSQAYAANLAQLTVHAADSLAQVRQSGS